MKRIEFIQKQVERYEAEWNRLVIELQHLDYFLDGRANSAFVFLINYDTTPCVVYKKGMEKEACEMRKVMYRRMVRKERMADSYRELLNNCKNTDTCQIYQKKNHTHIPSEYERVLRESDHLEESHNGRF